MNITSTSQNMNSIAKKIAKEHSLVPECVHKNLTLRSLVILKNICPESEKIFAPIVETLVSFSKRPDKKDDYENGMGRHYYCLTSPIGRKKSELNGYFRNGMGKYFKSARVMLEEDYTMALTMYVAGFYQRSAEFLGRAIHMLSDMCCIPHVCSMTYFSYARFFHKSYENLAEIIYPELVPEQIQPTLPNFFNEKNSFESDINAIAFETANGLHNMNGDLLENVKSHLKRTECILVKFLLRFLNDLTANEHDAHYITSGSGCRLMRRSAPLTIKIIKKGVIFHGVNPSPKSDINVTNQIFYVAHRHDGLFTFSPEKDKEGRVLEVLDGKFVWHKFDPIREGQLFRV